MDVRKASEELAARMSEQLRVRGTGLDEVAAKAGRKLPNHLRSEIAVIVEAVEMAENPKLARLIDESRIQKADRKVRKFLNKQDPARERRGEILDRLAAVGFVVFTIALILFFVAVSRGVFDTP